MLTRPFRQLNLLAASCAVRRSGNKKTASVYSLDGLVRGQKIQCIGLKTFGRKMKLIVKHNTVMASNKMNGPCKGLLVWDRETAEKSNG